jgi:uncharacterized protein (DUF1697 family)
MHTFVALLRGVNVGGSRRLAMTELSRLLTSLGFDGVRTYVQSGNAVFRANGSRKNLKGTIEQAIQETTGHEVTVMLRAPAELAAIAAANPFLEGSAEPRTLHVAFLDRAPTSAAVERLDPERSPPDAFHVDGTEIYLSYPKGSRRSRLDLGYLERTLGVRGTVRNWNTVTKLLELAQG